jgi:hypothetical protein
MTCFLFSKSGYDDFYMVPGLNIFIFENNVDCKSWSERNDLNND